MGERTLKESWASWLNEWKWKWFVALIFRDEENNLGYCKGGLGGVSEE